MAMKNKAYVVLTGAAAGNPTGLHGFTGGAISCTYVVIAPDGTGVDSNSTSAFFGYGDSNQAILQAVVEAVRSGQNDPDLDVNFVG